MPLVTEPLMLEEEYLYKYNVFPAVLQFSDEGYGIIVKMSDISCLSLRLLDLVGFLNYYSEPVHVLLKIPQYCFNIPFPMQLHHMSPYIYGCSFAFE